MADIPEWCVVGAKVIQWSPSTGFCGPIREIEKVYAQGRYGSVLISGVLISGTGVRFSPVGPQGRPLLRQNDGNSLWRSEFVVITPEVEAAIAAQRALETARRAIRDEADRLSDLARSGSADDILTEAAKITAREVADDAGK